MIHSSTTVEPHAESAVRPRYSLRTLLVTLAVLALVLVVALKLLQYNRESDVRQLFGGSAGLSTLRNADRAEAYRIESPPYQPNSATPAFSDYQILSGPIAVSQADAQRLLNTLQDRNSYIWNDVKACIPRPGVRLDFIHGGDRLSVLLCFECDILANYLNGKMVGGEDFDNARPALVRIVRSLFPDDPEIRSLTEQR